MEGTQSAGSTSTGEPLNAIYKVTFGATQATQSTYSAFIKDLINALIVHGSASHGLPVLPSDRDLKLTDPKRYVVVQVSNKGKNVSFVIDATTGYILGYRPGVGTASYFFTDIPQAVQNLFFQGTTKTDLKFDGSYKTLQNKAGVNRDQIPLGFARLRQQINNLNKSTHLPGDNEQIAHALIVCIEMISEAARLKVIQQQLAALAPVVAGGHDQTLSDSKQLGAMIEFQTGWTQLSTSIQTAKSDGTFTSNVTINHVTYTKVDSARPLIAILKKYIPRTTALDQVVDAGVGSE